MCRRLPPSPLTLPADTSATGLATYVVEPNFRDCFCVAHPTPRFTAVLEALPAAVVAERVSRLVLRFCSCLLRFCLCFVLRGRQQAGDSS